MLVGIVSDTHDNLEIARGAVDLFEDRNADVVVHCGDIVAPFTATVFDADFEFSAVRGNNDGEWNLQNAIESFGSYLGEMGELELDGLDVAIYHGTAEPLVDALLACGSYDYVFRGHTHEHVLEERDGTVHVNPGGLPFPEADDQYYVATLDTETTTVEHHRIA